VHLVGFNIREAQSELYVKLSSDEYLDVRSLR
jgi:hypothetical protein